MQTSKFCAELAKYKTNLNQNHLYISSFLEFECLECLQEPDMANIWSGPAFANPRSLFSNVPMLCNVWTWVRLGRFMVTAKPPPWGTCEVHWTNKLILGYTRGALNKQTNSNKTKQCRTNAEWIKQGLLGWYLPGPIFRIDFETPSANQLFGYRPFIVQKNPDCRQLITWLARYEQSKLEYNTLFLLH